MSQLQCVMHQSVYHLFIKGTKRLSQLQSKELEQQFPGLLKSILSNIE
ncbi:MULTISPECIES: hypothetical protein [Staphylococcus]|jgi:hypothetical protein|uniref:Uncharacterized protein n=1 Tax=Staphylococcus nepalensis TaxID=214473 RepID=A0A380GNN6_9STAP|nr:MULTISPECIES: hypothetical protein [Staphylococcus]VDG67347.1 Uncharacterised protein [Lacrimispora indolis]MBO1213745.1 hypothetical protein [Staphylococcus nepalensis]MBO1215033.1 hypothetical protein [Staphylococcus nepalensis]MBO1226989.1 hypothetical protein [Staphylococcus nepalensis]MBO1234103.1 hypothetical protein [Staphylococcus nepalensis]